MQMSVLVLAIAAVVTGTEAAVIVVKPAAVVKRAVVVKPAPKHHYIKPVKRWRRYHRWRRY